MTSLTVNQLSFLEVELPEVLNIHLDLYSLLKGTPINILFYKHVPGA